MSEGLGLSVDDLIADRSLTPEDEDRLGYTPIATRVAELALLAETPLNIALFGAWGSGKTSFGHLLEEALLRDGRDIGFVRYEAWAFTGEPLQRNFISHAASELGFGPNTKSGLPYHEELYEDTKSGRINANHFGWWDAGKLVAMVVFLLALIAATASGVISLVAIMFGGDPLATVIATMPGLLPASAVSALLVAAAKQVVDGLRVEVNRSAPTQEQLRGRFVQLVTQATKPRLLGGKDYDRLVFFVDELDRCPAEQVVETLSAIRSFFDEPKCVFVVAADRQVLERALNKRLRHEVPADEENPYRSSASEFFDKIFQYQLALPPLRGGRLQRYAREQVADRQGGIWAELRRRDADGHFLGEVLYALIPSHVRSPRRAKVLLNNFAANARIAASRGIDWLGRAPEIAKLTALQTEFPSLAVDLPVAPRLPAMLLDRPTRLTKRNKALVDKWCLDPGPEKPAAVTDAPVGAPVRPGEKEPGSDFEATDPTVRLTDAEEQAVHVAQREQLRLYLTRVRDYPDPGRDLLYLESAGATVDMANDDLARLIEDQAVDDPMSVIEAARPESVEEQRRAIRLLAQLVPNEVGPERSNVITALLGVAGNIGVDIGEAGQDAVAAVELLERDEGLDDRHLTPALSLAVATNSAGLAGRITADERLYVSPQRVQEVALLADRIPSTLRPQVWEHVASNLAEDPKVFLAPLGTLTPESARAMIVVAEPAIASYVEDQEADEQRDFAGQALDAVLEREPFVQAMAVDVSRLLLSLQVAPALDAFGERADATLPQLAERDANLLTLSALAQTRPEGWSDWSDRLRDGKTGDAETRAAAIKALRAVLAGHAAADVEVELASVVEGLLPHLPEADETWREVEAEVATALAVRPYQPPTRVEAQGRLHRAVLALGALGPPASDGAEAAVLADLERGLSATTVPGGLVAVRQVASALSVTAVRTLAQRVAETSVALTSATTRAIAQIELATRARALGDRLEGNLLPVLDTLEQLVRTRPEWLALWLHVLPPLDEVSDIARRLTVTPVAPREPAFERWAGLVGDDERTDLLKTLIDEPSIRWLFAAVAGPGTDDAALITALASKVEAAAHADSRREFGYLIVEVGARGTASQQRLAELITWTLARRKKVDIENAAALVGALPSDHRLGKHLEKAFQEASDDVGMTLSGADIERLRQRHIAFRKGGRRGLFGRR